MTTANSNIEQVATTIAHMDRQSIQKALLHFKGTKGLVKFDFTEDYLNSLSIERLRHILLAAQLELRIH